MLLHPHIAPTNKSPDRSRCSVENADCVFLDDPPKTIGLGPVRRAFVDQGGRAGGERTIDNIAMAGDPADISGAPENIFVAQIENVLRARVNADEITAGGVQDSLRLSGRAAGVKDVKRMLAIERDRRALRIDIFQFAMPPDVAPFLDVHLVSRP